MALSNMLNEPRRELTETAVGIGVAAGVCLLDYAFANWLADVTAGTPARAPLAIWLAVGLVVIIFGGMAIVAIHAIGDATCNALQRQGVHLRPRRRYVRTTRG